MTEMKNTLMLILGLLTSPGLVCSGCYDRTPKDMHTDRWNTGEVTYYGNDKYENCIWNLPRVSGGDYLMAIQITKINLARPDGQCYGNIKVEGVGNGLCKSDETENCQIYRQKYSRCQNYTPHMPNCSRFRSHDVTILPRTIKLLATGLDIVGTLWFELDYIFFACGTTTPMAATTANSMINIVPNSGPSATSNASSQAPNDASTSHTGEDSVKNNMMAGRPGPNTNEETLKTENYLVYIIVIIALGVLLLIACITICVGYFRYVRSRSTPNTQNSQTNSVEHRRMEVVENGNNGYSVVVDTEKTANKPNSQQVVQNVIYESF